MALDPQTARGWADVFGGGLSGAVIALLTLWNVWQFVLNRRDRKEATDALTRANQEHLVTAKSVAAIAQEFAVSMERLRGRHSSPPRRSEG